MMAKRARTAQWGCRKHKAPQESIRPPTCEILLKDRISELPHEIAVYILSQLKTKEAGRTSILSRKWRYVWTAIPTLIFDASEVMNDEEVMDDEVERPIYVSCVNQAIRRHQGQTIDQFAVVFSLDESSGSDIDEWVSFSLRKRVKILKLDLLSQVVSSRRNCYSFPQSLEISRCSSLTSLHLADVNITGELLQIFLCNCLNLESVFVTGSKTLVSLNIDGPLKLKKLDLHLCSNIKCLDVFAPNLVSFKYTGHRIPMPLKDVPKLLELSIAGCMSPYVLTHLQELFSCISQLEKLTLAAFAIERKRVEFPVLPKLKHLTLIILSSGFQKLTDYTSIIRACPSLYKLSLQAWFNMKWYSTGYHCKVEACPHNIKVVEFIGFRGQPSEVELATYIIENAVMLEKITFDSVIPGKIAFDGVRPKGRYTKPDRNEIHAKECARELGKIIPPSVELIII